MISRKYLFEKDEISLFRCKDFEEIKKDIETIFVRNKKILPKNKNAKILIKPNLNNDLNALTGNSTDLRIIVSVVESLQKRGYKDITLADGPNCGVNHIGIDVFGRLCLDKIADIYKIKLKNLNKEAGREVQLATGQGKLAAICLDSDFIINIPKMKTHVEAKMTLSCKNYIGTFIGTQKRQIHNNLPANIVRIAEIIKTDLIIVDGLIGMEGRGPGDGTPKKVGVILSGHDTFLMDFLVSKLMGLDYKNIPFLKIAIQKGHISKEDIKIIEMTERIAKFKPGEKTFFDRILLNNTFINIRFSKTFEKFFNKGFVPWILFKLGVKQDKYVFEEREIKRFYEKDNISEKDKEKIKKCLATYCPRGIKKLGDSKCINCMYCYQIFPNLIKYEGNLGSFRMQMERFDKYIRE
jgi:uncharacterized protein (DUF362 family)